MKRLPVILASAFLLAGAAAAQTTGTTTVTITPQQESAIKTYVTRERPASVTAPSGFTVAMGATLPETVELRTFPSDVGVTQRYAVIGNRTVLVGDDRKIIRVIE